MSQYTDLKNTIDANVNTNGVQSITGAVMNDVLNEIVDFAEGKQDALVSGTNIKTINGESILGSGDIEVQGGGGIAEEVEVYIGADEPTEDGAKLWVDTDEEDEPSSPSASVWNGGIYFLPIGLAESIHNGEEYVFTNAEAEEFRKVVANFVTAIIAIRHYEETGVLVVTPARQIERYAESPFDIKVDFPDDVRICAYIESGSIMIWEDEEGYIRSNY